MPGLAAAANGIDNVDFVAASSHKFRPAEPIDVIVQEQMGIALFDEGMVETIIDVRDRCLKPGGKILPARFEFYLEPVQLLAEERVPMAWEQPICRVHVSPAPDQIAGGLFPRDRAPADRFPAMRAVARVRVRSHDPDTRRASAAIFCPQAGQAARPARRHLRVFQGDLRRRDCVFDGSRCGQDPLADAFLSDAGASVSTGPNLCARGRGSRSLRLPRMVMACRAE